MKNDVLITQSSRQGIFEISSKLVNGKNSWISTNQAIWYVPNSKFWCIGNLNAIGTETCGVASKLGLNEDVLDCVYDVPKNGWEYQKNGIGWLEANSNDVEFDCKDKQGK